MKSQRERITEILKTRGEATSAEIIALLGPGTRSSSVLAVLKTVTDRGIFLRRSVPSADKSRDIWVYRLPETEIDNGKPEPAVKPEADNFRDALGLLLAEMRKDGFESVTVKDTGEVVFRRLVIEEGTLTL